MSCLNRQFPLIIFLSLICLIGCNRAASDRVQGYVEGEYVYVSSPLAGQLIQLNVARGTSVKAGEALFTLDLMPETAARDEAQSRLTLATSDLEDARKGKRPSELQSMEASLAQARATLDFAKSQFDRDEQLIKTNAVAVQDFDRHRADRDQALQRVNELEADLKTANMGSRTDVIAAAEAEVKARQAALAQAEWNLSQKHQNAPAVAIVFDTLYRQGEWVPAGRPVVQLLPPANIKVRAFVPESRVGQFHLGDAVSVYVDGVAASFDGKISFISPQAEFTPPVIYSQESREKFVFMVEAVFTPEVAAELHPGQPVDLIRTR